MPAPVKTIELAYSSDSAPFEAEQVYNQGDASGCIRLPAFRQRIRALAGKRGPA